MRTRVVFNQKGGVGKSSITVNLAAISAHQGLKTLVIDLDPQANSSQYLLGDDATYSADKPALEPNIENYFDKNVRTVVLIESIKKTKTKVGEEMAFLEASDETATSSFVVFARQIKLLEELEKKDIVEIQGRVTKRFDKYQINVNNIIKNK